MMRLRMTNRSRLMLVICLILLGLPVSCAVLNYNGVCIARFERIEDDRMIRIAVTELLENMRPPNSLWREDDGQLVRVDVPATKAPYADVAAFLSLNPGCCEISTNLTHLGRSASVMNRITGRLAGYVIIEYREQPNATTVEKKAHVAVTNCGRTWSGI